MDRFSGARHSAYTMRRFYPAMYGRNLTFAPSQYGATEPETLREKPVPQVAGEVIGVVAYREYERRTARSEAEAAAAREAMRLDAESKAEARKISAQALADQMSRKPSNPIPWLVGGLGIVVVGGLVYFNMSSKQA